MAAFGDLVRGIPAKYNILWFVLDIHHGQRYFFICGCHWTVTKYRPEAPKRPEMNGLF
jgi:hypothetical protein